jgi:hypothetical protein
MNSLSGYGARTRALYNDLLDLGVTPDLAITNWGHTLNFYSYTPTDGTEDDYDFIFFVGMLTDRVLLPSGKLYFVTAGIETDTMYDFNLGLEAKILTSSQHSSNLIKLSNTVLPESVPMTETRGSYDANIRRILISGAWIGGSQLGEDRKNIPHSIKVALDMISQSPNSSLYELWIHTTLGTYTEMERAYIHNLISHFNESSSVKIKLIHGILSESELYDVYSQCQVMFTLTHGEGFGRHLAEFMSVGGKLIAPRYSGYLDFADTEDNYLLVADLTKVPQSAVNRWILPESKWATVNGNEISNMFTWFNNLSESYWNTLSEINIESIKNNNDKSYNVLKKILFN